MFDSILDLITIEGNTNPKQCYVKDKKEAE